MGNKFIIYDESYRINQGGMGYLQFYAAVTWMRKWLKNINVSYTERGNFGGINQVNWEVNDDAGNPFWLSFNIKSFGHMLFSPDRKNWCEMDVTFHPAEGTLASDNWQMILLRLRNWRSHGPTAKVYKLRL